MNGTDNTGNTNPNVNQTTAGTNDSIFITPAPVGFDVPQNPVQPAPQQAPVSQSVPQQVTPVQSTVTPQPMPAPAQSVVTPQPMPAQVQPVTPTPVAQATVAPSANAPAPSVAPAPVSVPTTSEAVNATSEDPNAKIAEVNLPPSTPSVEEPQVINTKKSRGSNILLFVVIIILVLFAINIDKIAEMYENYMATGSLTATNVTPDNTTNGFIMINESKSSMKVKNINFQNFRKNGANYTVSFNYESYENYSDSTSLNIYIELYNGSKEILYKELFDTKTSIEKNTTVNYTIKIDSVIYDELFYALVKVYTPEELKSTSTLTCKYSDSNYNYENKYHFTNNSLESYDVVKQALDETDTGLQNEYNSLNGKFDITYNNNTLKYSIDLNKEISNYTPLYNKGLTPKLVKIKEETKKWICE